jgi:hypothetical protein
VSDEDQNPSEELISPFTSTTAGVMTDQVGAITGDLELLTHPAGNRIEARVKYAGAHDLYTVTGSPVRSTRAHQEAHETILERLTTPGRIEDGNELPVDLATRQ